MNVQSIAATGRSTVLRDATHPTHERLDAAIMAARPFDNLANYGRFLQVQYAFHRDVAPLYLHPELRALIPDLAARSRLERLEQDAADIGASLPRADAIPAATEELSLPEGLGWLYVIEGSNLGAAFLFKAALKLGLSADHGARHLAEAPEGRAAQWRTFKAALDGAPLSDAQEAACVAAAEAAFARVCAHVATYLA